MKRKDSLASVFLLTVKQNPGAAIALLVFIALSVGLDLLPPLALESAVDELTNNIFPGIIAALLYFGLTAAARLSDTVKESLITLFGQRSMHSLRSVMAEKLGRLPARYFTVHEPGATVSLFTNDVNTIDALFTSGIVSMFTDACKMLSILAVVWFKSRGLALLLLAATPPMFFFTRFCQKRTLAAQKLNRAAVARTSQQLPETMKNLRTIRSLRAERFMQSRYADAVEQGFRAQEQVNLFDAVYSPVVITVSAAVVAVMMTASAGNGAVRDLFGMSAGTAVALIAYVTKLFEPLADIGMEIQNIQSAAAGAGRIRDFLREEEKTASAEAGTAETSDAISVSGLHFAYPDGTELFRGLDLTVPEGGSVTLAGRTGVGKSTLLKLLLGLYEPSGGELRLFGRPVGSIAEDEKRSLYGYVEQQFRLVPGSVLDQVTLRDPDITREAAENALRTTGLYDTAAALPQGLDTPCTESTFSQGEFQLLSIARAIAGNPRILFLDEITANLDSSTEKRVLDALRGAMAERTVLSVSHRLQGLADVVTLK